MVDPGRLRHRVVVQTPTRVRDEYGEDVEAWGTLATTWASIEPLRGEERFVQQQAQPSVTHSVVIRHRREVTAGMRILHRGRVFQIRAIMTPGEIEEFMRLVCEERTDAVVDQG